MQHPLLSLSASAGSGKTHQLTMRYLELLLLGAKPSNILTLTFTRKAAKEMQERITHKIKELYDNKSNIEYLKNLEFITINNETQWEKIRKKIDHLYHTFLREDLKITTIDAFFQKILKNFCWYVDVEYDFQLQEDHLKAISEIFLEHLPSNLFEETLNLCYTKKQNLDAILKLCIFLDSFKESLHEELFLCDKTSENSIEYYKEQALFYANTIKQTYENCYSTLAKSLDFKDFESLLEKGKTWLTKKRLQDYPRDKFSKVPFRQEDFIALKDAIYHTFLKEEEDYLNNLYCIFTCFLKAKELYYQQEHCLSFNAVASKVYALQQLIHKDFLYFRLDSTLSHILIDEFQDTSSLQYAILSPLINEIKAGIGQKNFARSFFFVGDVKQSIYRFRGGNPKLFNIASKGMSLQNLDSNYRSAKVIVEFVNTTFKEIMPNFIPQLPKSNAQGFVEVVECETTHLHEKILESLQQLKTLNVPDEEITILCFNNAMVVELAEILQKAHFQVVIDTSAKLINHNEVRAIIALLNFTTTQNPLFRDSFFTLLGLEINVQTIKALECFLHTIGHITQPAKYILTIMESYHIASLSAKRFLEFSLQYQTLETLLDTVERLPLEIVSSDFSGIRLMTIHKSKGLEFNHVLVIDKTSQNNQQKEQVFFEYKENNIDIARIFKQSNQLRKSLDSAYKNALAKEEALIKQDLNNQLYVAFTRAKFSLHIFKLQEKSTFEILRLKQGSLGVLELPKLQQTHLIKEFCTIIKQKPSLENLGRQRDIYTQEDSLKEMQNALKDSTTQHFSLQSTYYGIALHFCLEQKLKCALSDAILLEILRNRYGFYLNEEVLEQMIKRANLLLKNENFIAIIAKGIVKCEVAFLSNGKQKRLDLLIIRKDEAFIIDYKSSAPHFSHILQVREYIELVSAMLHKKTYGYVFYSKEQEGKLIEIT